MNYLKFIFMFICIFTISCNNQQEKLNDKIFSLELKNNILEDSLRKLKYHNLVESELILIPQFYKSTNSSETMRGVFRTRENFPPFKLYYANEKFEYSDSNTLNYKIGNDNSFEFDFAKKNVIDNSFRVVTVFDLDTIKVELYGVIDIMDTIN